VEVVFWVDDGGGASSPDCERRWIILIGGIIRVLFELGTLWAPNAQTQKSKALKSQTRR
jgi:hypothetical protein